MLTTDDGLHPCDECGEIDSHQRWCTVQDTAAARVLSSAELDADRHWGGFWGMDG